MSEDVASISYLDCFLLSTSGNKRRWNEQWRLIIISRWIMKIHPMKIQPFHFMFLLWYPFHCSLWSNHSCALCQRILGCKLGVDSQNSLQSHPPYSFAWCVLWAFRGPLHLLLVGLTLLVIRPPPNLTHWSLSGLDSLSPTLRPYWAALSSPRLWRSEALIC